jgi:ketosteroid isomerase-like protein
MRNSRSIFIILAVLSVFILVFVPLQAQEWSAAQKEVWKNVEAYWDLFAQGNLEGFLSYMHADYRGWSNSSALPEDKASSRKWLEYSMKNMKTAVYEIKPVAIQIFGNVAIVHYYYSEIMKNAEGKEESNNGRWTDVLMKQDTKWVMIGDHGGNLSDD